MSQIKKGAFLDYVNIAITNIVGLILTPFIIQQLGNAEYGLYTVMGAFIGYIAVLDLGLGNAVVRFVAKYRAEGNRTAEENFLANTFLIYGIISLGIVLIGILLYYNLEAIFSDSFEPDQMRSAKVMFIILIFNLSITLPGKTFGAICRAYEHFVYPKILRISRYLIRSITVVGVLLLGGKAIALVIIDTLMSLSIVGANAYYVFKKLNISVKLHRFESALVKEIFSYSIWIFIAVLAGRFQWTSGQVVLGAVTNTTEVAIFAVGVMLGTYYGAFSAAISGLFLPRAMQMVVKKTSNKELTDLMIRIGRISFIVLMYILGAFALYGRQFVYLWINEGYFNAYVIALVIMLAYTVPLIQNFGNSLIMARNKVKFRGVLFITLAVMGMALGYWLALDHGMYGMLAGLMLSWIITHIILNIYYHRVLHLNMVRFFKEVAHKTIWCVLIAFSIGFLITCIPGQGWFNFVLKAICYSLVYCALLYKFGMIPYEKLLIRDTLRAIRQKIPL